MLPEVSFTFAPEGWLPHLVDIEERMSGLYEANIEVLSTEAISQPRELLGQRATLTFTREGSPPNHATGIVRAVRHLGLTAGQVRARVTLVPELWELSQRSHYRIFQNTNTLDIVREVLHDAGQMYAGDRLIVHADSGVHPAREYCVQYGETDLAFFMRLLEEEGITFFFQHAEGHESLVILDGAQTNRYQPSLIFGASSVSLMTGGAATSTSEHASRADWSGELRPTEYQTRDFDFTRPDTLNQTMTHRKTADKRGSRRRLSEYPGRHILHGYSDEGLSYTDQNGARFTEVRLQAEQVSASVAQVMSNVTGLRPGQTYPLSGHVDAALDRSYLVTSVRHRGVNPEAVQHEPNRSAVKSQDRYHNVVDCIPASTVYRPQRTTRRPTVQGPQTAIVSAEPGSSEEIDIDAHGRVLVRFHWDQNELRTERQRASRASCRVRTVQSWAGGSMGSFTFPRVGMEVLVTFLDGDPDRPVVTGCVYNGQGRTHLDLPTNKAHTTFRSESTPRGQGSGGHNELSFVDNAGSERVFLRAQHDMDSLVLNDETAKVGGTQTNTISGDRSTTIGSRGGESPVLSSDTLKVSKNVLIDAGQELKLVVGKSSITIWDGTITISVEGGASSKIVLSGGTIREEAKDNIDVTAKDVNVVGTSAIYLNCND